MKTTEKTMAEKVAENQQIIANAFKAANVPMQETEGYPQELLLEIISKYPHPQSLRREFFERNTKRNLAVILGADKETMSLVQYYLDSFPELLFREDDKLSTYEDIKDVVARFNDGQHDAITEYRVENLKFSKHNKIRDLVEDLFHNKVPEDSLSISYYEFALQVLTSPSYLRRAEKIFADSGFDYHKRGGDGTYDNAEEHKLNDQLKELIWSVYNEIKH
jgi:hypothetical protein